MTGLLEGKVAVVTGSGGGIGRGVALLLAEEGASVVVNDLGCGTDGRGSSRGPADAVVAEIGSRGGRAVASYDDVSLFDGGAGVVAAAMEAYGRLDVLVNCAAVLSEAAARELAPEEFDRVIRTNVKGTFVPIRHAAPVFRKQRGGRIVNFTSDAGLGERGGAGYAAASEAIVGMTRTVARDLGKYGVTCNAISPVATTRLFPGGTGSDADGPWEGPGAPDDPDNVAPLAVLLCTEAVPDLNGRVFGVEGGSIHLYSDPSVERSAHSWGPFTLDDLDDVMPATFGG